MERGVVGDVGDWVETEDCIGMRGDGTKMSEEHDCTTIHQNTNTDT